jgi:hypothetical protein
MDQYRFEKALELLYERQCQRVPPELRDKCGPIQETLEFLVMVRESNLETMSFEMRLKPIQACDDCGGKCFKS